MRRTVLALVGAASLAAAALISPAAQASPSPELASHAAHPLGMVLPAHAAGKLRTAGGNLSYHNGPTMTTNTVYAIYLTPTNYSLPVPTSYSGLVNRFFTDVSKDSGKTSNVYYSDTQYSSTQYGGILYQSAFGGAYYDTTPLPSSGCTDSYTTVCLSDLQIQTIVTNAISANKWPSGIGYEFFVFTPKGVGSCAGSSCSFSQFCAYHSWMGSGATSTLYANMPYADTVPAACDAGQHPNASLDPDADATINVTSHEHNETITDPNGNAWYDKRGYENGDKCAWNFGAVTGPSGAEYNQTINTNHYFLQQEWSNKSSGCVLKGL